MTNTVAWGWHLYSFGDILKYDIGGAILFNLLKHNNTIHHEILKFQRRKNFTEFY